MWPFGRWRRRKSGGWGLGGLTSRGDSLDLDDITELAEKNPTKTYTSLLMWEMAQQDVVELILWQSQPLPSVGQWEFPDWPSFESVVNRFKVMASLDPVIYHQPKEGRIELGIDRRGEGLETAIIHVRFSDTAPDRSVHLRLEWPENPAKPSLQPPETPPDPSGQHPTDRG
jgi:hypothetical protein